MHDPRLELAECIKRNLGHKASDMHWPMKFTITIWWLWHLRNMHCFGDPAAFPTDRIQFLLMKNEKTIKALPREIIGLRRCDSAGKEIWLGWEPPPADWVLLNTDGASR